MWCLQPGIERFNCLTSYFYNMYGGGFNDGLAVKVYSCNKLELFWKSIESFCHKKRSIGADMTPVLHLINQESRSFFYSIKIKSIPLKISAKLIPSIGNPIFQWRDIKLSGKLLVVKSRKCDCFSRRKSIQFVRVFNMNTIIHVFFWRIKNFFCIGSLFLLHAITMLLILTFWLRKKAGL